MYRHDHSTRSRPTHATATEQAPPGSSPGIGVSMWHYFVLRAASPSLRYFELRAVPSSRTWIAAEVREGCAALARAMEGTISLHRYEDRGATAGRRMLSCHRPRELEALTASYMSAPPESRQTAAPTLRRPRRPPRSCALVLGSGGDGHRDWSEQNGELEFARVGRSGHRRRR